MKITMNTFLIVLLAAGFIYLIVFHKPDNPSDEDLNAWFSSRLSDISSHLEMDIEQDKKGLYPHANQQSFKSHGSIIYLLADKQGKRFDVSDKNSVSSQTIMKTAGYLQLERQIQALNLSIFIKEIKLNADDDIADSFYQTDEYVDDHLRYFTVTISGW